MIAVWMLLAGGLRITVSVAVVLVDDCNVVQSKESDWMLIICPAEVADTPIFCKAELPLMALARLDAIEVSVSPDKTV